MRRRRRISNTQSLLLVHRASDAHHRKDKTDSEERKAEIISNKRKEYDNVECRRCLSWNRTASLNYLLLYSQVWQIELLSYLKLKITLREAGVAISLICLLLLNEFWELVWTRSLDGMLFSVSLYGEPRSLFSLCELTLILRRSCVVKFISVAPENEFRGVDGAWVSKWMLALEMRAILKYNVHVCGS